MTIQQRVGLLAGVEDVSIGIVSDMMKEAVRLVIGELPEEAIERLQVEETDSGTGVSIVGKRLIRAHKDGYPARILDSQIRARLTDETSYYEAQSYEPACYAIGGLAYVVPSGGTVVTVTPPTVDVSLSTVTGVEEMMLDLFIARCADLVITEFMRREREHMTATVDLPTLPSSVIAPVFMYTDAAAVAPSATSIDPLPNPELYFGPPSPTLPTAPVASTLDVSGIAVPTLPTLGEISYVPPEVSQVADVQIDPLPALPAFTPPVFGGSISLPTFPTLSFATDVDGQTIVQPTVPAVPAISYAAALASVIGSTAVAALPAVPTPPSAVFEGDISQVTANLPGSFTSSASPPSPPTLGSVSYVPPAVRTLQATTISALPSPPVLGSVAFEGDIASITANLPSSFVTAASPPIPPALPALSYTAVAEPVVVGATIAALPAVPSYSAPSYTGDPDSIISEIPVPVTDGDLTVPVAPTAPTVSYAGVYLGSIQETNISAFPTAPTVGDFPFEGDLSSIGAGLPNELDLTTEVDESTAITAPAAPTKPDLSYLPPSITQLSPTGITAPSSSVTYTPPAPEVLDWSVFDLYADEDVEDTEIMAAHLGKVRAQVEANAQLLQSRQTDMQRTVEIFQEEARREMEDARMANEFIMQQLQLVSNADIQNALNRAQIDVRGYELDLQQYQVDLQKYREKVETKVKEYQFNLERAIQGIVQRETLYLQKYGQDLQQKQAQFQGDVQSHLREVDYLIAQAQLDQQRLVQEYQTQADTQLRNAAQEVQLAIALYQGNLEGYRADAEVYATTMSGRMQMMQANIARVAQGYAEVERVKIQKYSADIQAALGKFQSDTSLWREQVQELIAQAQLDHQALELRVRDAKNVELQNAIQQAQMDIAEFQAYLQQYETSASVYRAQIEGEVAAFRANLELATGPIQAQQQLYLQKYIRDVDSRVAQFQGDMQDHMAEVNRLIRQAEITAQELQVEFQAGMDFDLRNAIQETQGQVEVLRAQLQTYQTQAEVYRITVEGEVAEFRANLELATGPVQAEQALYVQKFSSDIGLDTQRFTGEIQEYLKQVDIKVVDAQLAQQRLVEQAGLETNVALRNAEQDAAVKLQEYAQTLQRYGQSLAQYQAQITGVMDQWKLDYQKAFEPWATEQRLHLDHYTQDIQSASIEYSAVIQDHIREIDRVMKQADLTLQRLSLNAQMLTNQGLQNEAQRLQAQIANYRNQLDLTRTDVELYMARINAEVQVFTAQVNAETRIYEATIGGTTSIFTSQVQDARADWEARFSVYKAIVDRNMMVAQIARSEAQQTAEQSTQVDLANRAKQTDTAIALYQSNLAKHREDIESFNADVQSRLAKFQAEHQVRMDYLRSMNFDLTRIKARYKEARAAFIRFVWPHRSYTIRQSVI